MLILGFFGMLVCLAGIGVAFIVAMTSESPNE